VVTLTATGFDANPSGFAQALLQGADLDGIARRFGRARLFVSVVHRREL